MSEFSDSSIENEIKILKKELEEKERCLLLAAQYGKDLLDQNAELHTSIEKTIQEYDGKIENFLQEKYSMSMKIEAKERVIKTLSAEIETQENLQNETSKKIAPFEEEIAKLNTKILKYEDTIDTLQIEVKVYKEKSESLHTLLEETQQQQNEITDTTLNELNLEEHTRNLENQICSLTNEKLDLEREVLRFKSDLKASSLTLKNKECHLEKALCDLEEKECRITSMYNEVERSKRENEELRIEIDQMRLEETDPRRKGNSLFGELEDNRQVLEKQVLSLTSKFSSVRKQCERKTQQIAKLKLHVASLLHMTTSEADQQYQKHLEESLSSARNQLKESSSLQHSLEEEIRKQRLLIADHETRDSSSSDSCYKDNYLKHLYKEAVEKISSLEERSRDLEFAKVCLKDQLLQLQRKLHRVEKERDACKAEVVRINVKVEEMKTGKDDPQESQESSKKVEEVKVVVERLPSRDSEGESAKEDVIEMRGTLREKFIRVTTSGEAKQDLQNESRSPEVNKENEVPDFIVKGGEKKANKETRIVGFSAENEKEMEEMRANRPEKKIAPAKPRRKMEAPHIKVESSTQSEECKVQ